MSGKTKLLQCNVGKHFHDLGQTLNETQKCSLLGKRSVKGTILQLRHSVCQKRMRGKLQSGRRHFYCVYQSKDSNPECIKNS